MDRQALALKYRPTTFDDVVEQDAVKAILKNQIETGTFKSAYLFCGAAGTGKTTCARIFANAINKGQGNPIEIDAASYNGVEYIRRINEQAMSKSLDSEYKIFIMDECHALSDAAWQAMLKIIEEPPAKTIFIFATTDPQKIPKTILSRVQRYNFNRITTEAIKNQLVKVLDSEQIDYNEATAIEYIAKISEGGMRDALTLLDKCLSYNKGLSLDTVLEVLGSARYEDMIKLTDAYIYKDFKVILKIIENLYLSGADLKQFVKTYLRFILDVNEYILTGITDYLTIPTAYIKDITEYKNDPECLITLLELLIELNTDIKWDASPKTIIQAKMAMRCAE